MGYLIPRLDIYPDQELRYGPGPSYYPRLSQSLGRSLYHFGVPEALKHPGFPMLANSVRTLDLVLNKTNIHPIKPWRPGYISSNVVADLSLKAPSSKGG